ncbi:MAG: hypothetical protein M5U28_34600 [Sandaracinaceae bacterium]|nr:hypothetical protein [Sandaracinaceae bacterium]
MVVKPTAQNYASRQSRLHYAARSPLLPMTDAQLAAFRRLLSDAHRGGQAKVDALLALVQRTIFVVPWPGGIEGWRSLVNRDGVAALPIFTDKKELEEAARRYGWLDARGEAPSRRSARARPSTTPCARTSATSSSTSPRSTRSS